MKECSGGKTSTVICPAEEKITRLQVAEEKIEVIYNQLDLYIIEKDSKRLFVYNGQTHAVTSHNVNMTASFPHNFQPI
jgi:hypothetical protein